MKFSLNTVKNKNLNLIILNQPILMLQTFVVWTWLFLNNSLYLGGSSLFNAICEVTSGDTLECLKQEKQDRRDSTWFK